MVVSDPYFSTKRAVDRLLEQYEKHNNLLIAYDFDDTIFDFRGAGFRFDKVITLLKKCQSLKFTLILFTARETVPEIAFALHHSLEVLGIKPDYVNRSPVMPKSEKLFFNILLDDKCGLKQAYDTLNQAVKKIERIKKKCL